MNLFDKFASMCSVVIFISISLVVLIGALRLCYLMITGV